MVMDEIYKRLKRFSEAVALFGGLVLSGIAILVVCAVLAAKIGFPLLGDTEIVELAAAVGLFSFMPYCQMQKGHVAVTVFSSRFPSPARHGLDIIGHAAMTIVIAVLCWRLFAGGLDAFDRGRMSMFLQIPTWWAYALIVPPALLWVVTSFFVTLRTILGTDADDNSEAPV